LSEVADIHVGVPKYHFFASPATELHQGWQIAVGDEMPRRPRVPAVVGRKISYARAPACVE
jgi:hypothetical protein